MPNEPVVLRADDPRAAALQADGWTVTARSWAAQLTGVTVVRDRLERLVDRVRDVGEVREVMDADLHAVLELDAATLADYPGGVATRHEPLTPERARVSPERRAFGLFDVDGRALGVTYVDIDGRRAETDFTVVARDHRGLGVGAAVKAAPVLALADSGIGVFRTGGSADNPASLAANRSVGYVVDEQWVTLARL
ncbi:GNAT family N-acetyltransferase [Agromyces marinus]|uniref:N-acetyltransferase domain-containing protein n=1 Tax=Agromyces marinus TaxID=1389020 RepID=A0ABM8H173_9MICO|nr:acetyltransferase [Agromyces marinus]UIP57364.1 hypothetical protein DSM26151_02190 [Agromyces marinus]BDZ54528.1 hypothetical protein GCM10025870_16010 [Agromyces marinus]